MLEARGLPYDLIERDQSWALCVAAAMAPAAAEELTRYTAERSVRRPLAPPLLPFPGGAEGAIGFTAVLLLVSYCAGIRLFGADWYVVGALARSADLVRAPAPAARCTNVAGARQPDRVPLGLPPGRFGQIRRCRVHPLRR